MSIYITKELLEDLTQLTTGMLNEKGQEMFNPKPMFVELEKPALSMKDQIRRIIKLELSEQVMAQGGESFEEANDFDVDEDPEPMSPYEEMVPEYPIPAPGTGPQDQADPAHTPPAASPPTEPTEPVQQDLPLADPDTSSTA